MNLVHVNELLKLLLDVKGLKSHFCNSWFSCRMSLCGVLSITSKQYLRSSANFENFFKCKWVITDLMARNRKGFMVGQNPYSVKGTQSRFCAYARVWVLNRRLGIQRCGNWHRAFTNLFASSSINFGFALKLLRIKDQWYTVLVKCQFVCNRDLSVLTSMPFDGTSSGGKCYGAGQRWLSFGSFQKGFFKIVFIDFQ